MLLCVVVCCSVLPSDAVCCSVLQCVAVCCSVFAEMLFFAVASCYTYEWEYIHTQNTRYNAYNMYMLYNMYILYIHITLSRICMSTYMTFDMEKPVFTTFNNCIYI